MNLARSVLQHWCDRLRLGDNSLLAQLTFYGDESGNKDKSNVAVGGYLATKAQWDVLGDLWQEVLDDEHVEFFHRTDMEGPPYHEQFKDWDKERMKGVLRRLHRIIKKNTIKGVGEAIKVKAFQQI